MKGEAAAVAAAVAAAAAAAVATQRGASYALNLECLHVL